MELLPNQQFWLVHRRLLFIHLDTEVDETVFFFNWEKKILIYLNGFIEHLPNQKVEFHTAFWGQYCLYTSALQRAINTGKQLVQGQEMAELGLTLMDVTQSLCF